VNALISANHWAAAFFAYIFFGIFFMGFALFCCWQEAAAAGSGIPEIKSFLNGVNMKQFVKIRVLIAKLIGMCFSVASGIPTGKKGPIIHIGATLGAAVSQGGRTLGFDVSWVRFQDFRNDRTKRDFVTFGLAAGIASMFRSPIGGVLFALEEGASFWSSTLTFRAFFCAMLTLLTVNMLFTENDFGTSQNSGLFVFGQFHDLEEGSTNYRMYEIFIFILMGISGGIIGHGWNLISRATTRYYMTHFTEKKQKVYRGLIFVVVVSCVSFFLPLMWRICTKKPSGEDIAEWDDEEKLMLDNLVSFQCPMGYYNQMASLWFTSSDNAIRQLFHYREYEGSTYETFGSGALIIFFISYFVLFAATAGLMVPLGLFVPSILLGAVYGRLWGHILNVLFPGQVADAGTYALMGACAINGGITRMTISMTIIMLETAGNMTYLLPLMVTFGAARYTGNALGPGIYDIQLALKELPFLEPSLHTLGMLNYNPVTDIMATPVVTLQEIEKVSAVYAALRDTSHNGFPVVDYNGKLRGIILRKTLTSLLKLKAFSAPEISANLTRKKSFSIYGKTPMKEDRVAENAIELAPAATTVFYSTIESQYPDYPDIDSIDLAEDEKVCIELPAVD
jgi:chloride channel 7